MTTHNDDTPTNPTGPAGSGTNSNGGAYASAASVAGLAREIDALRHDLTGLLTMPARFDELAGLVAQLAEATALAGASGGPASVPSWLDLPTDPDTAERVLDRLVDWMGRIYLRYPDAHQGLPECWLWHPDIIEELLWLHHAWLTAYHQENAPVTAAADWHDRYRPGVVRRITTTAGRCSLDNHQPRDDRAPRSAPLVPLTDAVAGITTWWATHRSDPAPEPTAEQLTAVSGPRRLGSRR